MCFPIGAKQTMREARRGPRDPQLYTAKQMERGETYDPLWNATQKELLLRGKIHGYYRMYWGKKIIEWSPTYGDALALMIHLHDVYCAGWARSEYLHEYPLVLRTARPAMGHRPIFGSLRYMSFDGMKRKTNIQAYMDEIAEMERTGKDRFRI